MENRGVLIIALSALLVLGCESPVKERSDSDLHIADQLAAELTSMGLQASSAHYDKIIDDYCVSVVTKSHSLDDAANTLAKIPVSINLTYSGTVPDRRGVESLEVLANLVHLGFENTEVTSGLLDSLASLKSLRSLEFSHCEYTQDSPAKIHFPRLLTRLKMEDVNADVILAHVEKESLARLSEIDARESQFTGVGLAQVSSSKRLISLLLSTADIGDQSLVHLTNLNGLRTLELNNAPITFLGLRTLTALASLEKLALRDSGLMETDKCIIELRKFPNLQTLDLTGTRLDASKVRSVLPSVLVQPYP